MPARGAVGSELWKRRLALFPVSTQVIGPRGRDRLAIAGCDLQELARRYGTPLYVYDEATLAASVAAYRHALAEAYAAPARLVYAGKAFLCVALAQWLARQGLGVDCTGAGEVGIAVAAGMARDQIVVHGANKSRQDREAAFEHAGTIVVDNLGELETLRGLACGAGGPEVWLRLRPGRDVETHPHLRTGDLESKFGMDASEVRHAARLCLEHGLPLSGLHFHLGSQLRSPEPVGDAVDALLDTAAAIRAETGWLPAAISPGGGWGCAYHEDDLPHPPITVYVRFLADRLVRGCRARGLPLPCLSLEPGRSVVARAGVALYRVGTVKRSGERRWLLMDGGLADNPRHALYAARYSSLPVSRPDRPVLGPAWLGGPFCESGDVLAADLPLPDLQPGELLAVPMSGAYQLSMASNYNGALRPAVVWLADGAARLIRRRETIDDLLRRDCGL